MYLGLKLGIDKNELSLCWYNSSMNIDEVNDELDKPMQVVEAIPPLAFEYDPDDTRIQDTIDRVAGFCGYEFTEVPQNPDEEPGVPVPLADETPGEEEKDPNIEEPGSPSEPYPEWESDELDKLREAYKEALAEYHDERKAYWGKLWQVIRFISSITCWTDEPNDTFMTQMRKQVYDANQVCGCRPNCCGCDPDEIQIPLDYTPLDPEQPFVGGYITVMINGQPAKEKIPYEYLNSHYDATTGILHIIRDDFPDTLLYRGSCCCLCRRKLTITLIYNAGYSTVPAGLLPLICPLMAKMEDAKMGLSDCANAMTQVAGYLKMKKVGNIQYQWSDTDNNTQKTLALVSDLYNLASLDEVMALSRCLIAETPKEIGDVI